MQRKNILTGPGAATFGGVTLHDADGISADIDSATQDIPSSVSGKLDTIKTDQQGKVTLTPCGEITQDILDALFPHQAPLIGASVFGAADTLLVIHGTDGRKLTFLNAALTGIPDLLLSTVKTAFGQAEFTALTAPAQIPLRWETDVARPAPAQFTRYHGDAFRFEPAWLAYGQPLNTNGMTFTLYWQTNGMGSAWFTNDTAAGAFEWLPKYDTGASAYTFFIAAGGNNYQANGTLRMLPSPGLKPNALAPPVPSIDFAQTPFLNAPWLLPAALEGLATEV
ncbi:MAG: hypothetical protein FWG50_13380 [Kiritimatiellaeota bacterium]|nr:hypothetical protein [Kiritimatiellota bacterium]